MRRLAGKRLIFRLCESRSGMALLHRAAAPRSCSRAAEAQSCAEVRIHSLSKKSKLRLWPPRSSRCSLWLPLALSPLFGLRLTLGSPRLGSACELDLSISTHARESHEPPRWLGLLARLELKAGHIDIHHLATCFSPSVHAPFLLRSSPPSAHPPPIPLNTRSSSVDRAGIRSFHSSLPPFSQSFSLQ